MRKRCALHVVVLSALELAPDAWDALVQGQQAMVGTMDSNRLLLDGGKNDLSFSSGS